MVWVIEDEIINFSMWRLHRSQKTPSHKRRM